MTEVSNMMPVSTPSVANLPPVSTTPGVTFLTSTADDQWCTLSCEYLREFSKKIEMALMVY
jgi:hypothetical protein